MDGEELHWASWEVGQGHLEVAEIDRNKALYFCLQKPTFKKKNDVLF